MNLIRLSIERPIAVIAAVAGFAAAWFGRARAETQKPVAET